VKQKPPYIFKGHGDRSVVPFLKGGAWYVLFKR
jgi:hypothetical protein